MLTNRCLRIWIIPALVLILGMGFALGPALVSADERSNQTGRKDVSDFGNPRRGDVPEGAAEMITPQTEQAIKRGLNWLARSQSTDGSFGNGTYRGNIAVTSL